jgi:SulP family sulfate permease
MRPDPDWRQDIQAGVTVALVAIPQCMAFAAVAGLAPASGLYAAVAMGLVGALLSGVPQLNIGPSVTICPMVYAVLVSVAPHGPQERWAELAGTLTVLVGAMTVVAALLNVGQFVRFVSRTVLVGLMSGAAMLIFGSQLAPCLGLETARQPTLIQILWETLGSLGDARWSALIVAIGTILLISACARVSPRFPGPFLALVVGAGGVSAIEAAGIETGLASLGKIPRQWPTTGLPAFSATYGTDLIFGALAITLVGLIQTLAIAKAMGSRHRIRVDARRELFALAGGNIAAGFVRGFPGAGSIARSGLTEMSGARTRLAGVSMAVSIAIVVAALAPLAQHIPQAVIAGLLVSTAYSIVEWDQVRDILLRNRYERFVLLTTVLGVLLVPIHWAVLGGLAVSIAVFLRRVSKLHLVEMVDVGDGVFREQPLDECTGSSPITMLQVEGPLFFAQAEEIDERLREIIERRAEVIILRMRRTQQIDYSVVTTINQIARDYGQAGGSLIICGLTPAMHRLMLRSPLALSVGRGHLLETTSKVFGSAHAAIMLARAQFKGEPGHDLFRR